MTIRQAIEEDIDILAEIDFQSEHPMDVQRNLTLEQNKKYLLKRFEEGKEDFFIYQDKGYITLKNDFPGWKHCELYWLAVKKSCQRQGIGKQLVQFIEKYARELKFRKIFLYTGLVMVGAQIFYQKLGYHKINEFPDFFGFPGTTEEKTAILFGKEVEK